MKTTARLILLATSALQSGLSLGQGISQMTVGTTLDVLDVDQIEGASLGAHARIAWPLSPFLHAGVDLGYWADNEAVDTSTRVANLIVGLHGRSVSERFSFLPFRTYIDLGADLHRLTFTSSDTRRDETRAGWSAGMGGIYELQRRLDLTTGVQYRRIIGDKAVRLDQLVFSGGVQYRI